MASTIKISNVKEEIEKIGWELISTEYVNLTTDLEVKCPENHLNLVSFKKWRTGKYECPICKQNEYYKPSGAATQKKGYRILAFDQASITSGWSVFDQDKLISYGKWSSDGKDSIERIGQTKGWFASSILKWKPDKVILEDIQLQKFTATNGEGDAVLTYKKLAHLQGVLMNYLYENQIDFQVVSPSTWRNYSEIKGKTRTDKKKNAQLKVKKLYDVSVTQDEADAILIGTWGAAQHKRNEIIEF